jgi:hypothetical protein
MAEPLFALVVDGRVHALEVGSHDWPADLFDVRDVSAVPGIAVGWIANEGGTFSAPSMPQMDLDVLKSSLKAQVDGDAERERLKLITAGSGQAMEYQEAYSQAQAALNANGTAKPSDYPMLAATIGVDIDPDTGKPATDVLGVARSVKAAYEAFLKAGAAIRGVRLQSKAEINASADADMARAAYDAIKWPAFG